MSDSQFHAVSEVCERIGWPAPLVVDATASTNDDLVGRPGHGQILVAREQTAGRGRLDRRWISRPGEGLTFSVRLDVPAAAAWGWISLLAGVAVADAVQALGCRDIAVKWPNDVVAGTGKLAGILSVADGNSAIVGIGINVDFAGDPPDPNAISVAAAGGDPDPDRLLAEVVEGLHRWWGRWTQADCDAGRSGLYEAYRDQCRTVGAEVVVTASDGSFAGQGIDIDADGALLVTQGDSVVRVTAGDVTLST